MYPFTRSKSHEIEWDLTMDSIRSMASCWADAIWAVISGPWMFCEINQSFRPPAGTHCRDNSVGEE